METGEIKRDFGTLHVIEHIDEDGAWLAAMKNTRNDLVSLSMLGYGGDGWPIVSLYAAERRELAAFLLDGLPDE